MDIHEYQAKEILARFGVATPKGALAYSPEQAAYRARAERFPGRFRVIDTDAEPDEVRLRVERALRPWL